MTNKKRTKTGGKNKIKKEIKRSQILTELQSSIYLLTHVSIRHNHLFSTIAITYLGILTENIMPFPPKIQFECFLTVSVYIKCHYI